MIPRRIQLRRTKGWRKPPGAVVPARPAEATPTAWLSTTPKSAWG